MCTSCRPSLTSYGVSYFFIPHSLWLTPLRSRALLDCELFFLQPILFFPFYSLATISCRNTLSFLLWRYLTSTCWAILGLLLILLSMTQYGHLGFVLHCLWALLSHLFPLGHPWPICFPWASLALFVTLHSHRLLLTPLGFLGLITLSFILKAHGLAINSYFLCLHYFGLAVAHSHFSISHTAHEFVTSLSPGSFRPICFLKAHLFILWAYNPLFLPLGLNDFSIHLLTLFYPCCWASSFYWASQNGH